MRSFDIPARTLLASILLTAVGASLAQQGYPSKTIRLITPYPAGGGTSVVAHLLGQKLSESWGQQVIVDNRPGGNTIIGTDSLAKSPPDGYTLILVVSTYAIVPSLFQTPYDPIKDLAQVSRIAESPSFLMVRSGLGVKTLAELVALGKEKPGQITFGSGGAGSSAHLATELLLNVAGVKALHVPFRGVAAAIADVIAGRVDMVIASLASGVAHVQAGTLVGLAVSGNKRSELLPAVPTFAEAGQPRYDVSYWWGIAAPAATPKPVVERLNREIIKACAQPRLREAFAKNAALPATNTPDEMTAYLKSEIAKWARVVKAAGVQPE